MKKPSCTRQLGRDSFRLQSLSGQGQYILLGALSGQHLEQLLITLGCLLNQLTRIDMTLNSGNGLFRELSLGADTQNVPHIISDRLFVKGWRFLACTTRYRDILGAQKPT